MTLDTEQALLENGTVANRGFISQASISMWARIKINIHIVVSANSTTMGVM
jgi:hypothetical protein